MNIKQISSAVLFLALLTFMGFSPLYGGDPARTGTAAGTQLQVPVGAQALGMGGANLSKIQGIEALYWNPAGLSGMSSKAVGSFSTMQIFNDVNVNYIALAFNAGGTGVIGVSLKTFDFGDIPFTTLQDVDGTSGRTFSPTFFTLGATYSKRLTDAIQFGFTGKLVSESVDRASASAIAFDAGLQYHNLGSINGLSMGLVVKNIGTDMRYGGSAFLVEARDAGASGTDFREIPTASNKLPATIELGVGYRYNINEDNALHIDGTFLNENFGNDAFRFGAEYMYSDLISLRGGYLVATELDSEDQLYRFTLGVGLHTAVGGTDLRFDYAFRDSQYFDGNNLFQLTIGF